MKTLQRQNSWSLQSLRDGTGRRQLTIASRELSQPAPRRRIALRRNRAMKLAVTFDPGESSGFAPVIRTIS